MKKKNILLISSMMLVVLLIAGGTMAWFTATAPSVENNFKAGTMELIIHEDFEDQINVNPGDCFTKDVWVENRGSKRAVVRVRVDEIFDDAKLLSTDVVSYKLNEGWFKQTIENIDYFVYNEVLAPINDEKTNTTGYLFENNGVCFDGKAMGNEYQNAKYTMTIHAEAIQSTHEAPAEWGLEVNGDIVKSK